MSRPVAVRESVREATRTSHRSVEEISAEKWGPQAVAMGMLTAGQTGRQGLQGRSGQLSSDRRGFAGLQDGFRWELLAVVPPASLPEVPSPEHVLFTVERLIQFEQDGLQ